MLNFRKAQQNEGESLDSFHTRLRTLAKTFEFADADKAIKEKALREDFGLTALLKAGRGLELSETTASETQLWFIDYKLAPTTRGVWTPFWPRARMIDRCHNTTRDILEWIDGNKRNTFRTGRNVRCVHCTMGRDVLPYIVCIGMCHGIGYGLVSGHLATNNLITVNHKPNRLIRCLCYIERRVAMTYQATSYNSLVLSHKWLEHCVVHFNDAKAFWNT